MKMLERGRLALANGEIEQARSAFVEAVLDEGLAASWLWLSEVVGLVEERRYCLQQAVEIDDTNSAAWTGLQRLGIGISRRPSCIAEAVALPMPNFELTHAPVPANLLDTRYCHSAYDVVLASAKMLSRDEQLSLISGLVQSLRETER